MDFKDFRDGLISLSLILFIFSLTFLLGSFFLQPYIGLKIIDKDFILFLCVINLLFSFYYLIEAIRLEKLYKLEEKYLIRFGKRIGIITIIYSIHSIFFISLLFRNLPEIQTMMTIIILPIELCLISTVFKEVFDLLFIGQSQLKMDLEKNRRLYLTREKESHFED